MTSPSGKRFATGHKPHGYQENRAAVEWWATWMEQGQELTFAGVTLLRFDEQGKVVEHRDYDNHVKRREPPYAEWSSA